MPLVTQLSLSYNDCTRNTPYASTCSTFLYPPYSVEVDDSTRSPVPLASGFRTCSKSFYLRILFYLVSRIRGIDSFTEELIRQSAKWNWERESSSYDTAEPESQMLSEGEYISAIAQRNQIEIFLTIHVWSLSSGGTLDVDLKFETWGEESITIQFYTVLG